MKVISRLFLTSSKKSGRGSRSFIFKTFKHFSQQQNTPEKNDNASSRFEEIEEAEFEDVTNENNSGTKPAD